MSSLRYSNSTSTGISKSTSSARHCLSTDSMVGPSWSATSTLRKGTSASNPGAPGVTTVLQLRTLPRPDAIFHSTSCEKQLEQSLRGGYCTCPQLWQCCNRISPLAQPAQKGLVSGVGFGTGLLLTGLPQCRESRSHGSIERPPDHEPNPPLR